MKGYAKILVLMLGLLCSGGLAKSQGLLSLGASGLTGFPDTTYFGDTIENLQVWVVNRGILPLTNVLVQVLGSSNQGLPIQLGTLDLTLGILAPGDSMQVPMDDYTVSTQNSSPGSNVVVVWPTAPGTEPEDSAVGGYYIDPLTSIAGRQTPQAVTVYPNPGTGILHFQGDAMLAGCLVKVHAVDGVAVAHHRLGAAQTLDLTGLPSGMYFYRIDFGNGSYKGGKFLINRDL